MGVGKAVIGRVDAVIPEGIADPQLGLGLLGGIQVADGRALAAEGEVAALQDAARRGAVGLQGHLGDTLANGAGLQVDGADLAGLDAVQAVRSLVIGHADQGRIVLNRNLAQLLQASVGGVVAQQPRKAVRIRIVGLSQQGAVLIGHDGIGARQFLHIPGRATGQVDTDRPVIALEIIVPGERLISHAQDDVGLDGIGIVVVKLDHVIPVHIAHHG